MSYELPGQFGDRAGRSQQVGGHFQPLPFIKPCEVLQILGAGRPDEQLLALHGPESTRYPSRPVRDEHAPAKLYAKLCIDARFGLYQPAAGAVASGPHTVQNTELPLEIAMNAEVVANLTFRYTALNCNV